MTTRITGKSSAQKMYSGRSFAQ